MSERLEDLINQGRRNIEVTPEELQEARSRRDQLATALLAAFPGSRIYYNGSVAHGDATTPLNDVDIGVVVIGISGFGPPSQGPTELMEAARDAIKDHLKDDYPHLHVTVEGQRRAVLVRFGDPVTPGQPDFTSDVIVALDHPSGRGLFIPNLEIDAEWDHADPETHTRLVLEAIEKTDVTFARLIRLLKHWRDRHSEPMCSWNIKALALECITEPMPLLRALQVFFTYAADSIAKDFTDDPADVAGKIVLNVSRAGAAHRLRVARDNVNEAIRHENAGRPASAQHALHKVLPAVIPDSHPANRTREAARAGGVGSATTITRAWGP